MHEITVYISLSSQEKHLVIDGNLELLKQFLRSLGSREFETGLVCMLKRESTQSESKVCKTPPQQP